jgi:NB-ARC domain-containing protein
MQPLTPTSIEALIEGGVSGQVAVGNYNLQIHAELGAIVHFTPPGSRPAPRLRPLPVLQRPRAIRGLLDREEDVNAALAAIGTALPVGVHGPPGIGKSTLLRHLAHAVETETLTDGVVHLSARREAAEDLLQSLFEAFYECDAPFKPTAVQARQLLQGRKALVLLDDAELGREAAEVLLDSAPDCAFALATREQCLWGECRAIGLGGLPPEDARTLFERELGRPLAGEEGPAFESLYSRLGGHPLRLLQVAAQVRDGRPLEEAEPVEEATARRTLAPLPDEQKRVLSALAAVGGGPVNTAHLAVLADVSDPLPALEALVERKLVQAHSPRYSLTGDLPDTLPRTWDLSAWSERALVHFTAWAEARREDPAALLEESGVLRHLLEWAARAGRHAETRRLGRALDTGLIVGGRWGFWAETLERVRGAAAAAGDRGTEGWAMHQLGTRLLCLGDPAGARQLLGQALAIRESLRDHAGAAVTRHNLGLLGPLPSSSAGRPLLFPLLPWLAVLLLVLIAGEIRLLSSRSESTGDETEVPISTDQELTTEDLGTPVVTESTTDLTTDLTETPPLVTTDHPVDEPLPEIPGTAQEPEEPGVQGWCCADGEVFQSTDAECRDRRGGFFRRERAAAAACLMFGCCVDGDFKLGETRDRCDEQGGAYMSAIEVPLRCRAQQQGWCCLPGGVLVQISREACRRGRGTFFQSEAEARRTCTIR